MLKNLDKYTEVEVDSQIRLLVQPGTKQYRRGVCDIIVSPPYYNAGWHMSISTRYRDPIWEEIKDAWYDLVPDADIKNAAMFFPPKNEYISVSKHCFHVHEVPLDIKMSF